MDRSAAFGLLPELHQQALSLSSAGIDTDHIAERLSLDRSAIRPLLEIAAAKFEALMVTEAPDRDD